MDNLFFTHNRKKFSEQMLDDSIAVFFSGVYRRDTCDQLIHPFSVERNFYYLTGIDRDNMILLIHKSATMVKEYLFILPVDPMYERWQALMMRPPEASEISGISDILYTYEFEKTLSNCMYGDSFADKIYLYFDIAEMYEALTPAQSFAQKFQKIYPAAKILNSKPIMIKLRQQKHPVEVKEIQVAIDHTIDAMLYMVSQLKPGCYEYEAKANYQYYLLTHGSKPRFRSIVAAGKNATILHYNNSNYQMQEGDLLLVDAGAMNNWYVSDLTRTFPVNGTFTPRQRLIYDIVLEGELLAIEKMRYGVTWYEVERALRNSLAKSLKLAKIIQDESELDKYYFHGSGHPIGLDLHDIKDREQVFLEGGVHTIESGLYFSDEGFGIRIEDNILIKKDETINLSARLVKSADDIENLFA